MRKPIQIVMHMDNFSKKAQIAHWGQNVEYVNSKISGILDELNIAVKSCNEAELVKAGEWAKGAEKERLVNYLRAVWIDRFSTKVPQQVKSDIVVKSGKAPILLNGHKLNRDFYAGIKSHG